MTLPIDKPPPSPTAERPHVIREKGQMRSWSRSQRSAGKRIAFVPTMGFLHQGHLSLIEQAKLHADVVVVSIYVNPSQFAPTEDLATYPSDLEGDLEKLAGIGGVDVAFCPGNLYEGGGTDGKGLSCLEVEGSGHQTWVRVEGLEKGLCGKSRPIFFRGVATVVVKLFNIVDPDVAVVGKKDYQQWKVVLRMVRDLDFAVKVIGSEIVREADGLAMSSRNVHLSSEDREKALSINRSLTVARINARSKQTSCNELKKIVVEAITEAGGRVDYAEIVDQDTLMPVEQIRNPAAFCVAAYFGSVRLIDNVEIDV